MSLDCKLVPVQYREYEIGLLLILFEQKACLLRMIASCYTKNTQPGRTYNILNQRQLFKSKADKSNNTVSKVSEPFRLFF